MKQEHGGAIYGKNKIRLDFSVNTNPLGMPESVERAVREHPEDWSRYPDSRCRELKNQLASYYNQNLGGGFDIEKDSEWKQSFLPEHFICGNGAADLIYSLVFALKPKRALLFVPSFAEYEAALLGGGCEIEKIVLKEADGFEVKMPERIEEIAAVFSRKRIDMIFLGNPNNPTGRAVDGEALQLLAAFCQEKGIFLVLDECFNWFLPCPGQYSAAHMIKRFPKLLILNAFTKIFSMAGLRLGYGICGDGNVLKRIEGCRQPWSVSGAAMRAGICALAEEDFIMKSRKFVETEREFMEGELAALEFLVYPSDSNYLLFKDRSGALLLEPLESRGILIRSCESFEGLGRGYYRTCVKLRKENEELLANLKELLNKTGDE